MPGVDGVDVRVFNCWSVLMNLRYWGFSIYHNYTGYLFFEWCHLGFHVQIHKQVCFSC